MNVKYAIETRRETLNSEEYFEVSNNNM